MARSRRQPGAGARTFLRWRWRGGAAAWLLALGGTAGAWAEEPAVEEESRPPEETPDRGLYVLLGGGVEEHTGGLAPLLRPGLSYGATLGYRLGGPVGVELAYSGSLLEVKEGTGPGGLAPGADVARNGVHAALTLGLVPTRAQPYVLGGLGVERFEVRGGEERGLTDDTGAFLPAGAGVRFKVDDLLTADARVTYSVPLRQEFAPEVGGGRDGRVQLLVQVGGTY